MKTKKNSINNRTELLSECTQTEECLKLIFLLALVEEGILRPRKEKRNLKLAA